MFAFGGNSNYTHPTAVVKGGATPGHSRADVSPLLLMPKAVKTGELYKLGLKVKNWKKRYCVLTNDCLYYFTKPEADQQQGEVVLFDVTGVKADNKLKKPNVFVLESERRHFYFQATDEIEMKEWITALNKFIS